MKQIPSGTELARPFMPAKDFELSRKFYETLGWRADLDFAAGNEYRVIQMTPPGSGCSIIFGKNVTAAASGSLHGVHLIVSDLESASRLRVGVSGSMIVDRVWPPP